MNIGRRLGLVGLTALSVLLQLSLVPAVRPFGVVPNLVLAVVILLGLEASVSLAVGAAVVAGVVLDMSSATVFGLWTGTLVLAALVAGLVARSGFMLAGGLIGAVLVAASMVAMTVVTLAGVAGSASRWPWAWLAGGLVLQLGLNALLTLALRPLVRWLAPARADMLVAGD